MGIGDLRIESVKDLPPMGTLVNYIKQAVKNNEKVPLKRKSSAPQKKAPPKMPKAPTYFLKALKANRKALTHYEAFSPSAKRDYIDWLVDAKTEETRERRLEQSIDWISEGKKRHWKYQKA